MSALGVKEEKGDMTIAENTFATTVDAHNAASSAAVLAAARESMVALEADEEDFLNDDFDDLADGEAGFVGAFRLEEPAPPSIALTKPTTRPPSADAAARQTILRPLFW